MRKRSGQQSSPSSSPMSPLEAPVTYRMVDGVVEWSSQMAWQKPVTWREFRQDVERVLAVVKDSECITACRSRMSILRHKFDMHRILNDHYESKEQFLHQDLFSAVKVDNSVRLATAMDCETLLRFMVDKARGAGGGDIVATAPETGKPLTLRELMRKHDIVDPTALTVEGLGLQPGPFRRFHRFDMFSVKYSKGSEGSVELLRIFLKSRNGVEGRYFAELVHPLLQRHDEPDSRVATEYRTPIFGSSRDEWHALAKWVHQHNLTSRNNRYIVQIPRIEELRSSDTYRECQTLQQQLDNIFLPLWEASVHPKSHAELDDLLRHVSAINVISDELLRTQDLPDQRPPAQWPWSENPSDVFFSYYIWANLQALNTFRASRKLSTLSYRPNCAEKPNLDNMVTSFLLADSINHGVRMTVSPVLQYLFYLTQIGMCLCPLANNGLYIPYADNPFLPFFKAGLRVSLSTDDPLHFHHTREPLLEEYGTAAKIYRLTDVDLCEIARNSVIISGFDENLKAEWLAPWLETCIGDPSGISPLNGVCANGRHQSIRLCFRYHTLVKEKEILVAKVRKFQRNQNRRQSVDSFRTPHARGHPMLQRDASFVAAPSESIREAYDWLGDDVAEDPYVTFQRVDILGPCEDNPRVVKVVGLIKEALDLRAKYIAPPPPPWQSVMPHTADVMQLANDHADVDLECELRNGIPHVFHKSAPELGDLYPVHDVAEFIADFNRLNDIVENVDVQAMCYARLNLLDHKFALHNALNTGSTESSVNTRDFHQCYKVDTHVHMAAGMTAKQLLEFLIDKAEYHGNDVVKVDEMGNTVTLSELLRRYNIDVHKLTVDTLNVQADASMFERFDLFKQRYNLLGNKELRELVLRTDNAMGGRYFAELIKKTFQQFEEDAYTFAENRISVYGKRRNEWSKLAEWFHTHGMASKHNKWLIQVPRAYHVIHASGKVRNFGEVLSNLFIPLWEVSIDPHRNPILEHFLSRHVSGIDCVDNESTTDLPFNAGLAPQDWSTEENPPYSYWLYYLWANITALNRYRSERGRSTLLFRPHCGESGHINHLLTGFLLAHAINHGINMRHNPAIEYLYYLAQIGVAVSPLSNTYLFLEYMNNPFPDFFRRGLNVSLSTDDPLQFHLTQEPLIEEYSIAAKQWRLSVTDMCEIARNSVLQSGYSHEIKQQWLGVRYYLSSSLGNEATMSHVPDIRIAYRFETYHDEVNHLERVLGTKGSLQRALLTKEEEDEILRSASTSKSTAPIKESKPSRRRGLSRSAIAMSGSQHYRELDLLRRPLLEDSLSEAHGPGTLVNLSSETLA
eukprot:TRINITY_DN17591_c0_g1_i1.p1 TRINITY_DN17591_c0_g1~~TRINITY_DN17591_c0_g1_i1.p1  ORF type:complete len:1308 (+),score=190.02 TRINITY_DN17591_c0_g1_i1:456-4379(+)